MARGNLRKTITKAHSALEDLSDRYTNPRAVEADLRILAGALAELGIQLKAIPKSKKNPSLCEVIQSFSEAELLPHEALTICREIEKLVSVADYDISSPEEFAAEVKTEIDLLREVLRRRFASLNENAAAQD